MNTNIFRQYDIRGIADSDLTDDVVFALGRAFATMARRTLGKDATIGVGQDMRVSSERLFAVLTRGMRASGGSIVDLGMVPTPLVYFAKYTAGLDAVVQITGSHNPGDYNGFKMMIGTETLHGETIQQLRQLIESADFDDVPDGGIRLESMLVPDYLAYVGENVVLGPRRLKVAVDCGNGVAGVCAIALVRDVLGCEVVPLFVLPDGSFPNHHPDPTVPENLTDLIAAVREHQCDVGVAYDGDGDRIGIVDEHGTIIFGDTLLILLSRAVLAERPGATIIGEVKCSQTLFDDVEAHGGTAIMSMVGHSLIKAKIKETNAELAGEMSGHVFYNDRYFGYDDALYTTARLLEILSKTDASVSELLSDLPETFVTPEIRYDCPDEVKFDVPSLVAKRFESDFDVNTLDGVRINFGDGWALCRASNTQPALVLRVEASTEARRDALLADMYAAVEEAERQLGSTAR